jgi:acetyl-CoA carboxylase biotin carboxylase subunit
MEKRKFKKVLVANRGEIALRILRTLREMGIESVAVYSTADKDSLHVAFADESVCIGPPSPRESYLNVQNIIAAAEITGADAIHPGYGFLSENAAFVEILSQCEIAFIGPSADSIKRMGNKVEARRLMMKSNVPVVPGSEGVVKTPEEGLIIARDCGFPVMLKASAGGGGRGMRLVREEAEFASLFEMASQEALAGFGNGDMYVEKFVVEPRHIEVQILADSYGNVIHLGERNCSVQRNHQKLVEEAPSPGISDALRVKIYEAAMQAARAIGYENAGTIEFLVDKDENFYFMEMNTRLQVEHPVTEMITGVDIVREQIRIAEGGELSLRPQEVRFNGHAIEFRINAEDPDNNFMPSPGRVEKLIVPGGPGIRIDSMTWSGCEILPFYDSMIAKLIVHADSREEAIARARRALSEFCIEGVSSTVDLHMRILDSKVFCSGVFSTDFIRAEILP